MFELNIEINKGDDTNFKHNETFYYVVFNSAHYINQHFYLLHFTHNIV